MKKFDTNFMEINTKLIFVDRRYQRVLNEKEIKKIVKDFNPNLVVEPWVSLRDNKYWVFNGQHTIAALKELNGGRDLTIICKVFSGMTYQDEAILFAKQRGDEKRVTIGERLNGFDVGNDEEIHAFKALVEDAGYTCDFKNYSGNGRLACYSCAIGIYKQIGGPDRLRNILEICNGAWGMEADGIRSEIIGGLNIVLRDNADVYDKKRMIKKLTEVAPIVIVRNGKARGKNGNTRFAEEIIDIYNKRLGKYPELEIKRRR